MDLYLLRHGETVANLQRKWQGHTDAPLSPRGEKQVRALGERLRGEDFALRLSSDLGRARTTAEHAIVAFEEDEAFREAHVGAWEGMSIHDVMARYPEQMTGLMQGDPETSLGGGETLGGFHERLDRGVDALRLRVPTGARVAVVSHGGAIAALVARALGLRGSPFSKALGRISNTSITVLRYDDESPDGRLVRLNDALHLDTKPKELRSAGEQDERSSVFSAHEEPDFALPDDDAALHALALKHPRARLRASELHALAARLARVGDTPHRLAPLDESGSLRLIVEKDAVQLADYNVPRTR
jgi:broad specificity phosphatase PhoE